MPTLGAAAIGAGASLFGASQQSSAANSAAKAQAQAAAAALAQQQAEFNTIQAQGQANQAATRADTAPYATAGATALGALSSFSQATPLTQASVTPTTAAQVPTYQAPDLSTSAFQADPGYQFALNSGERSVLGGQLAKGLAGSGSLGSALINYATNAADQEYGNYVTRATNTAAQNFNAANTSFADQNTLNNQTYNQQSANFQQALGAQQTLAGYGQNANTLNANVATGTLGQLNSASQNLANQSSGLITGAGNASAANSATQGLIGSNLTGQLAGIGSGLINYAQTGNTLGASLPTAASLGISSYGSGGITAPSIPGNLTNLSGSVPYVSFGGT